MTLVAAADSFLVGVAACGFVSAGFPGGRKGGGMRRGAGAFAGVVRGGGVDVGGARTFGRRRGSEGGRRGEQARLRVVEVVIVVAARVGRGFSGEGEPSSELEENKELEVK